MRRFSQITAQLSALRNSVLILTAVYVLQPLSVSAQQLRVCHAAGDPCSKFVTKYIQPWVTLLTVLIGVIAVISLILAAIQYSAAGDDPGAVSKAKDRIFQTVVGLLGYLFLFAFLNFLVPGGLF